MRSNFKLIACFIILLSALCGNSYGAAATDTIGSYVRASDYVVYAELLISSISEAKVITGKLKVMEALKGKPDKDEISVSISVFNPNNSHKLKSDLSSLNISASEDIELSGSSIKNVIAMIQKADDGYNILRLITFFRADKLELYLDSYREIVSMIKINNAKKLLKAIQYNLAEEYSYSLYNHCIDELFNLDLDFGTLFSTLKKFLIYKGERKNYSWFKFLKKAGKRLEQDYENAAKAANDDFFGFLYDSFSNEEESDYTNKRFLEMFIDLKRLIIKDKKWSKKLYEAIKNKRLQVEGLGEDHYRNQKLEELRKKLLHSLSKDF